MKKCNLKRKTFFIRNFSPSSYLPLEVKGWSDNEYYFYKKGKEWVSYDPKTGLRICSHKMLYKCVEKSHKYDERLHNARQLEPYKVMVENFALSLSLLNATRQNLSSKKG